MTAKEPVSLKNILTAFLVWAKKALAYLRKVLPKKNSQPIGKRFFTYEDITLKLYLEISNEYDIGKLAKTKRKQSYDESIEVWEAIIRSSCIDSDNITFINHFNLAKAHVNLIAKYNIVKAQLTKLTLLDDRKLIEPIVRELAKDGYKINTKNSGTYAESIESALRQSNNIMTKILSKQVQLKAYTSDVKERPTLETLLTNLSFNLGLMNVNIPITDDLTLARYNKLSKLVKEYGVRSKQAGRIQ